MGLRKIAGSLAWLISALMTTNATAHEMFLKAPEYLVPANSDQVVRLINGTFDKSENSISRDRMEDVSIASNGRTIHPALNDWYDDENSSYLNYRTGDPGTYVIGVSTRANMITMTPSDFIKYLEHEGILDTLSEFKYQSTLTEVRERYSKHVRTIVQVGARRSDDYSKSLGYPIEIILDQNPYDLKFGSELSFRVLYESKPVANQIVRASYEGFHGHDDSGGHINSYSLRTDEEGRARFLLSNRAVWYIALINMQKIDDPDADYVSNWATVTFEVK